MNLTTEAVCLILISSIVALNIPQIFTYILDTITNRYKKFKK